MTLELPTAVRVGGTFFFVPSFGYDCIHTFKCLLDRKYLCVLGGGGDADNIGVFKAESPEDGRSLSF